ncbi:hypothetical protein NPIL_264121 [Nephila pilipes]|uniref:Uncharacterized protein n=1 Tax=Nephila pilipes TaxID=299642 RepID=A0A8X6MQH9_NEPPI|nr:hypothetical protein NPIL_264121 [Nephila pilipes]
MAMHCASLQTNNPSIPIIKPSFVLAKQRHRENSDLGDANKIQKIDPTTCNKSSSLIIEDPPESLQIDDPPSPTPSLS